MYTVTSILSSVLPQKDGIEESSPFNTFKQSYIGEDASNTNMSLTNDIIGKQNHTDVGPTSAYESDTLLHDGSEMRYNSRTKSRA
jgi:hypothetical protein